MEEYAIRLWICPDGDIRTRYFLCLDGILEICRNCDYGNQLMQLFTESNDNSIRNKYKINIHIWLIDKFIEELQSSAIYKRAFINKLHKRGCFQKSSCVDLVIRCKSADSYVINYNWALMLWREINLEIERESATSWLSTLGGAYSSLGDYASKFAETAFKISTQQIRLALCAGDKDMVARGWVFLSLALSQLGYGKLARHYLRKAYLHKSFDPRHINMCIGVHSKLKYDSKVRRIKRRNGGNTRSDLTALLKSLKL